MAPAMCQYSLNLGAVSQVLSLPEGSWVCSATVDPPSVTYMHAVPPSLPSVNVISGCGVRLWVLQPQASASVPFETRHFCVLYAGQAFPDSVKSFRFISSVYPLQQPNTLVYHIFEVSSQ